MTKIKKIVIIGLNIFFALSIIEKSFAGALEVFTQDAFAGGRGAAFTATADNPSAVHYNPAGLVQIESAQIEKNFWGISMQSDFSGSAGSDKSKSDFIPTSQIYFATPLAKKLYFGFGVYSPMGLITEWNDDSPLRSYATKSELINIAITPALAYKINDKLSIGVGFVTNYVKADLKRGVFRQGDLLQFDADGINFGFTLGLLYQINQNHSIGINYRSASKIDLEGDLSQKFTLPLADGSSMKINNKSDAEAEVKLPQRLILGYSFRPCEKLNFEINAEWTNWSTLENLTIKNSGNDLIDQLNWEDSFSVMVGVTRFFENSQYLSIGYLFTESASPDADFNPRMPDVDQHFITLGWGITYKKLDIALNYMLGFGSREVNGSSPTLAGVSADGDYDFLAHAVTASAIYKF